MAGRLRAIRCLVGLIAALACPASAARAQVTIDFDTTFDSNNFFVNHPLALVALQTAGTTITASSTVGSRSMA